MRRECAQWIPSALKNFRQSVLIEFIIESARKSVVEPPETVGPGLCSAASHDTSCDSLFTVLALNALKPWLDKPAKESTCKRCLSVRNTSPSHNTVPSHWTQSSHTSSCKRVMENCAFLSGKQHVSMDWICQKCHIQFTETHRFKISNQVKQILC